MIRVLFLLTVATARLAAPAEPQKTDEHEKSADSSDKVICKRFTTTGSLMQGYRTCKTKREWERERDALRSAVGGGACGNTGDGAGCQ